MLKFKADLGVRIRNVLWAAAVCVLLLGVVSAFQRPWREYPGFEYSNFPVPLDSQEKTEWVFARLMYPRSTATVTAIGQKAALTGPWIIRARTAISAKLYAGSPAFTCAQSSSL